MTAVLEPAEHTALRLLWVDLTRKCQLNCVHCLNDSKAEGTHGTMSRQNWISVLDQAKASGVGEVRFIGGEVTMHPDAAELVSHALDLGLQTEIFSNLVHVAAGWWELFQRDGVSVATSYYSDDAAEHDAITGRRSHARTLANIGKAVKLGIVLRVAIVAVHEGQRTGSARREMEALGVTAVHVSRVRPFGRAAGGQSPDAARLCGRCGTGAASVGPDGKVSPCVFSTWMRVGDVRDTSLADILHSAEMARANSAIQVACGPDEDESDGDDDECSPGFPGSGCSPRR
ncbi:Radical SAM superfamily enzyme, MoaA/NifB/PqqE/SkfB family [Sinosporangium album]|uniref:Radical SAM superfamily enzyme, MoaA/NifB/PqqE/SkfB family n=1 Tax=Sinosporangium album TaxID=504805 RepID=A0A1G7SII4_9ACTN|nr:radical SAM protein [Sinosporangium album]SDG22712.1 Radical SAM superfamily enzyme, MoaA/NifB/PqqE/SkfB family [Sinosporangium album]